MARATPVLPEVASTIVPPGPSSPRASASSIMARAIRSLTLPPGLNHSSLAKMRAAAAGDSACSSTRGVSPIASSTLPAGRAARSGVSFKAKAGSAWLSTITKKAPAKPGLERLRKAGLVGLLRAACRVALAAVDRLAVGRVERNLGLLAAAVAGHVVEGALAPFARSRLALVAARPCTAWARW